MQTCPICNNTVEGDAPSCPYCGYHLLGSTQSFTPVAMKTMEPGDIGEGKKFDLRIVRGPQTGVDIDLREGKMSIGRDPKCDIFLNDMTVSRYHAEIEVGSTSCIIWDLNSFNGVWINDRMVEKCLLKSGDIIQIGAFCLVYRERPSTNG